MVELLMGRYRQDRAREIWQQNLQWQALMEQAFQMALEGLAAAPTAKLNLVVDANLPADMIGPIAGKLRDRLGLPAIVITTKNGLLVGECRGYEPFDFPAFLSSQFELFIQYGGHKQAAGFTVKPGSEEAVTGHITAAAASFAGLIERPRPLTLAFDDVDRLEGIEPLLGRFVADSPYGPGNPEPIVKIRRLVLPQGTSVPATIGYRQLSDIQHRIDLEATPVMAGIDVTHSGAILLNILQRA